MPFEAFAIVELMGRQQIAGKVSEEMVAGSAMLRVDVPEIQNRPAFTKFYSPGAIYCITPTNEAVVLLAAGRLDVAPVSPYFLIQAHPSLTEKIVLDDDGIEVVDFFEPDDDDERDYDPPDPIDFIPYDPSADEMN